MTIAPRQGQYGGMPACRCWRLLVHCAKPEAVMVNGQPVTEWEYDASKERLSLPGLDALAEKDLIVTITIGP